VIYHVRFLSDCGSTTSNPPLILGLHFEFSLLVRSTTSDSSSACRLSRRLRINVCGLQFETFVSLLDRHPSTLLGDHRQRMCFYDASTDQLFLDRHRPTFEAVFATSLTRRTQLPRTTQSITAIGMPTLITLNAVFANLSDHFVCQL